ncbi:MAG: damage-inducible protein CinA [Alphaproteobacteria bacterium]|nr:MAG: damage-inducible protein CinA [Alphaproteobacteria bacterium]
MDTIKALFDALEAKHWTITTAESCTGGMIAGAITDVSGSSAYFDRGFVTYSNEAKMEMLDVNPITIKAYGAVSEQCARLMARGAYAHSKADIAISVTGIAGPDGGSDEKPVGLVYIGLATDDHAEVHEHNFNGDRASIRTQTVEAALRHVINYCS